MRQESPAAEDPSDELLEHHARWRVVERFAIEHEDDLDALALVSQERRRDGASFVFTLDDIRYEVDLYLVDGVPATSRIKRMSLDREPLPATPKSR